MTTHRPHETSIQVPKGWQIHRQQSTYSTQLCFLYLDIAIGHQAMSMVSHCPICSCRSPCAWQARSGHTAPRPTTRNPAQRTASICRYHVLPALVLMHVHGLAQQLEQACAGGKATCSSSCATIIEATDCYSSLPKAPGKVHRFLDRTKSISMTSRQPAPQLL